MKAILCTHYGGPETLQFGQVPDPLPREDEILVRIKAAAANSADVRTRSLDAPGLLKPVMRLIIGWNRPRNPILGNVFAGVVETAGTKVKAFKPGDRVFGSTGFKTGGYAEKIAVRADSSVALMPASAGFEEAVALPFGGQTALYFLRKADIRPGYPVMVYGASGAVGTMATQLLKMRGALVTAVSSAANHGFVRSLGADRVLDYTTEAFEQDATHYALVFDCVGFLPAKKAKARLRPGGKYLTVGGLDVASEIKSDLQALSEWFDEGQIKAVIDRVYPLEEAAEAHRYLETKRKRGSVILTVE